MDKCIGDGNEIRVVAHLPPIKSAICGSARGRGLLLKLVIPESEIGSAFRLQLLDESDLLQVRLDRAAEAQAQDEAHRGAETLHFVARLDARDDAVMRAGNGDGIQLHLRIPRCEAAHAIEVQLWTNLNLTANLRVLDEKERQTFLAREKDDQAVDPPEGDRTKGKATKGEAAKKSGAGARSSGDGRKSASRWVRL
jgi:hypothetical protein